MQWEYGSTIRKLQPMETEATLKFRIGNDISSAASKLMSFRAALFKMLLYYALASSFALHLAGSVHPAFAECHTNFTPEQVAPVKQFIERGSCVLDLQSSDLNGDGLKDYILVLERSKFQKDQDGDPIGQRPLLIILGKPNGEVHLAKRNDRIVYCSTCGGMLGDPFIGVSAGKKTFTVEHYGGSAWRWSNKATFNYSRRDRTWQLVRVEHETFNVNMTDEDGGIGGDHKVTRETPPKNYGKIDIADFDPDNYLGVGPK